MKIAIDFDETITDNTPYPVMGNLRENCQEVIERLSQKGVEFFLYTSRKGDDYVAACRKIQEWKLKIHIQSFNGKPNMDFFIDDRSLFCKKIDWLEIEELVMEKLKGEK